MERSVCEDVEEAVVTAFAFTPRVDTRDQWPAERSACIRRGCACSPPELQLTPSSKRRSARRVLAGGVGSRMGGMHDVGACLRLRFTFRTLTRHTQEIKSTHRLRRQVFDPLVSIS